jgi:putative phosphoribosyl transferase
MALQFERQQEENLVQIQMEDCTLEGNLAVPVHTQAVILFAHGSGSSRLSRRNRFVADYLNGNGLATLLIDLLTSQEEQIDIYTHQIRFNIDLLASRLAQAMDWLKNNPTTSRLQIGLFGSSTGAAAALTAAALRPETVQAVVSRGGRPDLATQALERVKAPVLLLVGGHDIGVIDINRAKYEELKCEKKLVIVPGATHLFEEPGALEDVSYLASNWFTRHLSAPQTVD